MELDVSYAQICYWACVAIVAFAYIGYPTIIWVFARFRPRPVRRGGSTLPAFSIVLAVYNESRSIAQRLQDLIDQIIAGGLFGEIVVVSDGSNDGTTGVVREFSSRLGPVAVRLINLEKNVGKAVAISVGCQVARYEVVVFADARQRWFPDALTRLLENFADPQVGAVSGELVVEKAPGVMGGIGLYWRYEKWLRRQEALIHSTVGLSGAICAVRRRLFRPIPAGTLLDDVYWPLQVAMQNYRVVFDSRAQAFDRLPEVIVAEFRRKVRTLSGNFQLIARLPAALLPWRNPVWFPLICHKLLRLVVPWAWGAAMIGSALIGGPVYGTLFAAQVATTLLGVGGLIPAVAARSRLASAAGSFLVLNAAAWYAFWVWIAGQSSYSWAKTTYRRLPSEGEMVPAALAGVSK
jgi:biofilm PGA synthesis N-glycosyltransferase PgaC